MEIHVKGSTRVINSEHVVPEDYEQTLYSG